METLQARPLRQPQVSGDATTEVIPKWYAVRRTCPTLLAEFKPSKITYGGSSKESGVEGGNTTANLQVLFAAPPSYRRQTDLVVALPVAMSLVHGTSCWNP